MATWTDAEQRVWTFDDDKLDFDAWLKSDVDREQKWLDACANFLTWRNENPDANPGSHEGESARIFSEWILYSNAIHAI